MLRNNGNKLVFFDYDGGFRVNSGHQDITDILRDLWKIEDLHYDGWFDTIIEDMDKFLEEDFEMKSEFLAKWGITPTEAWIRIEQGIPL